MQLRSIGKKLGIVLLVMVLLSGCTALEGVVAGADLLAPAKNGIELDLTIGKREDNLGVEVGNQSSQSQQQAEEITNNIETITPLVLILLVLGWLLPSPNEMFRGVKNMILFWRSKE